MSTGGAGSPTRVFREEGRCARGYRFVHARLAEELGRPVSEKVVREAMGRRGLRPVYLRRGRRYSSYAGEIDDAPANLPLRGDGTHDFSPASPNALWASDITEFRLPCGAKVYLSPVVDLFDSRPVAWAIGARPTAALANESLSRACAALRPAAATTGGRGGSRSAGSTASPARCPGRAGARTTPRWRGSSGG